MTRDRMQQQRFELKFNNRFPGCFNEMVQLFNLTRAAAAKYCEGIAALCYPELGNGSADPVRGRVTPSRPEWMTTLLAASPTGIAGIIPQRPLPMNHTPFHNASALAVQ